MSDRVDGEREWKKERRTRENQARRHAHATVPVVDSTSQQAARASNLLPPREQNPKAGNREFKDTLTFLLNCLAGGGGVKSCAFSSE